MTTSADPVRPRRSLLFVPALRPDRYGKALDSGADIVCIDMEDAVALDRKDEGRTLTLPLFAQPSHPHVERMVRINALSTYHGLKDLQALIDCEAPPPTIMIPKIRSAEEIQLIDTLLATGPARSIRYFDDPEGLAREARACAQLGFTGKASIHPNQLAAIHEAFSPSEAQVAKARKVCRAFEESTSGLVVVDNELIELPVVRSYYRILAIAERIAATREGA